MGTGAPNDITREELVRRLIEAGVDVMEIAAQCRVKVASVEMLKIRLEREREAAGIRKKKSRLHDVKLLTTGVTDDPPIWKGIEYHGAHGRLWSIFLDAKYNVVCRVRVAQPLRGQVDPPLTVQDMDDFLQEVREIHAIMDLMGGQGNGEQS